MTHAKVATEIMEAIDLGLDVPPIKVTRSVRQGDLSLVRTSDVEVTNGFSKTPDGGLVLADGTHGEHRLFASRYRMIENRLSLPDGGTVVHTDQPHARHRPCSLTAGVWRVGRSREISPVDFMEQQVQD